MLQLVYSKGIQCHLDKVWELSIHQQLAEVWSNVTSRGTAFRASISFDFDIASSNYQ